MFKKLFAKKDTQANAQQFGGKQMTGMGNVNQQQKPGATAQPQQARKVVKKKGEVNELSVVYFLLLLCVFNRNYASPTFLKMLKNVKNYYKKLLNS